MNQTVAPEDALPPRREGEPSLADVVADIYRPRPAMMTLSRLLAYLAAGAALYAAGILAIYHVAQWLF